MTYKEVKRPAKAGEYIKITTAYYTFNIPGDIMQVAFGEKDGFVAVYAKDHPGITGKRDNQTWSYCPEQYVVLEGYKPPEETLKTFEMVARAEEDGRTYVSNDMFYNRKTGFTRKNGEMWPASAWEDEGNSVDKSGLYQFIHCDGWESVDVEIRKEMTLEEIEEELGYKIKIKEEENERR